MPKPGPDDFLERRCASRGLRVVAGVDEAGRGPLAGPVVAAAVVLDFARLPDGLNNSKLLAAATRNRIDAAIRASARVAVGIATVDEIDRLNILRAAHLAMLRAIAGLDPGPGHCLIDGNLLPRDLTVPAEAIVGGDALSLSIAAASIVAKVARDRIMVDLAQQHPGYGWETNMGYPVPAHLEALRICGITPHHRRSFAPVHNILYQGKTLTL